MAKAPPYTLADEGIELQDWHFLYRDSLVHLDSGIPGWDYEYPLTLSRKININSKEVLKSCGLPLGTVLRFAVVASCPTSRYRECVAQSIIPAGKTVEETVRFSLESSLLTEKIRLISGLYLAKERTFKPFKANLEGSCIFREEFDCELEGEMSRLPIRELDFAKALPSLNAPNANWHLFWFHQNIDAPIMNAMQVFINTRNKDFVAACLDENPAVISMLSSEISRLIVGKALDDEEFIADPDQFADGTIAQVALRIIRVSFPGAAMAGIRDMRSEEPEKFSSMIQSGVGFDG